MKRFKDPYYKAIEGDIPLDKRRRFIIDCDAGADDAHAVMLAYYMIKE